MQNSINKLQKTGARLMENLQNKKYPVKFKILKNSYESLIKSIQKSDFNGTTSAYISEVNSLKSLIQTAKEFNLQEELKIYQSRLDDVLALLKEKGISFKD